MMDKEIMRGEAARYRLLADQLQERFADIDDETLCDTLQGLSDFPDKIAQIVRSGLDDEAVIAGLKMRLDAMNERMARFRTRVERKRALACWAMGAARLPRLDQADFTVFLRQGGQKLQVEDETKLPKDYLVPQPPKINRALLTEVLKAGTSVEGANLVMGEPHIAVRTT
jgi:hypothetical protein